MKQFHIAVLVLGILLFAGAAAVPALAAQFEAPAFITSAGQSPGALMVRVLADQAGVANVFDATAAADALAGAKSFILVIGASMKGLGAAGIDVPEEFARVESLLAKAKELGIPVIAMHVEGSPRRGSTSDELTQLIMPYASYAIVRADGNDDGFFSQVAGQHGVTLEVIEKTADAAAVLRALYGN